MIPPMKTLDAPGTLVIWFAMKPPVQDSARASFRFRSLKRRTTVSAILLRLGFDNFRIEISDDVTFQFVRRAKGADILITEGTRVMDAGPEDGSRITEESVCETCRGAVEVSKGLVIADFSARNFERLEAFREIAARTGRELVVTARDLYMLYALFTVDGVKRWEGVRVYDEITDHDRRKWEAELVVPLAGDLYVKHDAIRKDPGQYILCFSFFDMNHLLDIRPDGGSYLYSSCEPFSEEMEIDFRRLREWLTFFHIEPCGFSMKKNEAGDMVPEMDRRYHASGHASGADVAWVIDEIDPEVIIPVHTENPGWFTERFEGVIVPVEGKRYPFGEERS